MSRVLLIGRGPLPAPAQRHTGFAQLRTAHFLTALRSAGHAVDLLLIEADEEKGLLDRGCQLAQAAEVVVSAGPHRPAAVAAAVAGDRPTWIDLPGDPLAEQQAVCLAPGSCVTPTRMAAAQASALAALLRADHLSVISERQRSACLGQLLVLGRSLEQEVPVSTVPIAYDLPLARSDARALPPSGPLRLLLCGAVAPWLDDQTLAEGLDLALARERRLEVVFAGGAVAGHYEAGAARLQAWAQASPHANRITWHGWVPHQDLEGILQRCHVGLCLDRPGTEPHLGSRTRVLLYAWAGLHIAASPRCELVGALVDQDLATALPVGDPEGLADRLQGLCERPPSADRARAASEWLERNFAPLALAAPLVAFAGAPQRRPQGARPEARLAEEIESLRAQLAAVHRSPTWRTLSRLHRFARRARGGNPPES